MFGTLTQLPSVDRYVADVLTASGFSQRDGWFYPAGDPDRAAVRILVTEDKYEIWRRRRLRCPWLKITSANTKEFDESAFLSWCRDWPLTN